MTATKEQDQALGCIVRALCEKMADLYPPSRGIVIPGWKDHQSFHVVVTPEEADMNPGKVDAIVKEKLLLLERSVAEASR